MIWIILTVSVIGFIIFRFFSDFFSARNQDNVELQRQALEEKFNVIVNMINDAAFNGKGKLMDKVPKFFNLYEDGQNQIITFLYGTGHLTITWRYKYLQNEVIHERQFNNVRNISVYDQKRIAETMISEMAKVVEKHKIKISQSIYNNLL